MIFKHTNMTADPFHTDNMCQIGFHLQVHDKGHHTAFSFKGGAFPDLSYEMAVSGSAGSSP